ELLDAKAGEINIDRTLQQSDRTAGDDSASCGLARDGDGVAELRPPARAKISCGDSRHRCGHGTGVAGCTSFHFPNDAASVLRCSGHLQRLWPFVLAPGRVPNGNCGGLRLDPLWKSVEVTERFEGKIEPLSYRQQTAKNVGDPTYEFWIVPQRHLESHGWRRQSRLLENLVKSEAHLRVCAGTPKGL